MFYFDHSQTIWRVMLNQVGHFILKFFSNTFKCFLLPFKSVFKYLFNLQRLRDCFLTRLVFPCKLVKELIFFWILITFKSLFKYLMFLFAFLLHLNFHWIDEMFTSLGSAKNWQVSFNDPYLYTLKGWPGY